MNVKIGISFDGFSTFSETLEVAKQSENFGMKKIELAKTSKNEGSLLDFFRRAKRAGKIFRSMIFRKKAL